MTGSRRTSITTCIIEGPNCRDCPLLQAAGRVHRANGFKLGDVCADKA